MAHQRIQRHSGGAKGTGAPWPWPAPARPGTLPAPPDDGERTQSSETKGVPPLYVFIHTPLPSAQFFNLDPHANDRMCDKDFIADLLTDEGPSTGWYTIGCGMMQLTAILSTTAAFWVKMTAKTRVHWRERVFWVLSLSTIRWHFKVHFKGHIYMHH